MKRVTLLGIFILIVLISTDVMAQFILSGELRPRAEYRHGFKAMPNDGDDPAFFISQRSRINADYSSEKFKTFFSLQDIRVWGDLPQLAAADQKFTIHQAWGEYFFTNNFSLKAGRQEIIYDDSRIFGNVDWAQQGRSHDAALLRFKHGNFKADGGFAYNQESEKLFDNVYTIGGNYKAMQYIWLHNDFSGLGVSLLALNNGMQHENKTDTTFHTAYSQTLGGRVTYGIGSLSLATAGYYQMGKNAANRKLNAYYAALSADYKVSGLISLGLGIEMLSGTNEADKANPSYTDNSFTPFYGTNHKFNGHMDYFYVGNHSGSVGLNDLYGSIKLSKGIYSSMITAHYFLTAADVMDKNDPSKIMDAALGLEIDWSFGIKLHEKVNAQIGYSHMFGTETLETLRGGSKSETANWAWAMLVFKPEFFKL